MNKKEFNTAVKQVLYLNPASVDQKIEQLIAAGKNSEEDYFSAFKPLLNENKIVLKLEETPHSSEAEKYLAVIYQKGKIINKKYFQKNKKASYWLGVEAVELIREILK